MIEIKDLRKSYYVGTENQLDVLKGLNIFIDQGEFVAIVGQSGSGKSTLMNVIGALDTPTSGEYILDDIPIQSMSSRELSIIRNQKIGFVFQSFNLIGRSTALKNVELPMLYAGVGQSERTKRAKELLAKMDMTDRMKHFPNELSGGQKQRVAIARALANDPPMILADEPTGALDTQTGNMVMDLFMDIYKNEGKTIVFITHSNELASLCPRIVTISDGQIISDRLNPMAER